MSGWIQAAMQQNTIVILLTIVENSLVFRRMNETLAEKKLSGRGLFA